MESRAQANGNPRLGSVRLARAFVLDLRAVLVAQLAQVRLAPGPELTEHLLGGHGVSVPGVREPGEAGLTLWEVVTHDSVGRLASVLPGGVADVHGVVQDPDDFFAHFTINGVPLGAENLEPRVGIQEGALQVGIIHGGAVEKRTGERRSGEVGTAQVRVAERDAREVGPREVGAHALGVPDGCTAQVRSREVGSREVGSAPLHEHEVHAREVGTGEVQLAAGVRRVPGIDSIFSLENESEVIGVSHEAPFLQLNPVDGTRRSRMFGEY